MNSRRPSPALVVALVALFLALGGTSYAAITTLPKNSVGTKQLTNGAVTGAKIANGSVTAANIDTGGLTVPTASHATSANSATSATTATTATHATTADSATSAGTATNAANAAELGEHPPGFYLAASAVQRIGPVRVSACTSISCSSETDLITSGQLTFSVDCSSLTNPSLQQSADIYLTSSANGAAYTATNSLNQTFSQPNMSSTQSYGLAKSELGTVGQPVFVSASGKALSADGHQILFDLYLGQNTGGASDGGCVFGGSFVSS
jgi:hypothetical protein